VRKTRASQTPGFNARVRDVIAAAAMALVLLLTNTTGPLDQILWTAQARIHAFKPSGEIVFVGTDGEFGDHRFPQRRRELAHALERLADTQDEMFAEPVTGSGPFNSFLPGEELRETPLWMP